MKIAILVIFSVVVLAAVASDLKCKQGETKMADCNHCFCSGGQWACTLKACLRKRAIPARFEEVSRNKRDEFSCIPGQTFAKECNTCTCTADGKNAICTLRPCNSQTD